MDLKIQKNIYYTIELLQYAFSQNNLLKREQMCRGFTVANSVFYNTNQVKSFFHAWRKNTSFHVSSFQPTTKQADDFNNPSSSHLNQLLQTVQNITSKPYRSHSALIKIYNLVEARLLSTFYQLKITSESRRSKKKLHFILIKYLSNIVDLTTQQQISKTFRKWNASCLCKPLTKDIKSTRLKGRLAWALASHIQPSMSKSQAFTRWRVRTDGKAIREAVAKFSLYSRINSQTAMWRLKSVLSLRKIEEIRRAREQRMHQAARLFNGWTMRAIDSNKSKAFRILREEWMSKRLMLKTLLTLQKSLTKSYRIPFDTWKTLNSLHVLEEKQKIFLRISTSMKNSLQGAFIKWKGDILINKLISKEKLEVASTRLKLLLESKLNDNIRDAFSELKGVHRFIKVTQMASELHQSQTLNGIIKLVLLANRKNYILQQKALHQLRNKAFNMYQNKIDALILFVQYKKQLLKDIFGKLKHHCTITQNNNEAKMANQILEIMNSRLITISKILFDNNDQPARKNAIKFERSNYSKLNLT